MATRQWTLWAEDELRTKLSAAAGETLMAEALEAERTGAVAREQRTSKAVEAVRDTTETVVAAEAEARRVAVAELKRELLAAVHGQVEAADTRAEAVARAVAAAEIATVQHKHTTEGLRDNIRDEGAAREALELELRRTQRQVEALAEAASSLQADTLAAHHTLSAALDSTWSSVAQEAAHTARAAEAAELKLGAELSALEARVHTERTALEVCLKPAREKPAFELAAFQSPALPPHKSTSPEDVRGSGRATTPSWVLRDTAQPCFGMYQLSQGSSTHSPRFATIQATVEAKLAAVNLGLDSTGAELSRLADTVHAASTATAAAQHSTEAMVELTELKLVERLEELQRHQAAATRVIIMGNNIE